MKRSSALVFAIGLLVLPLCGCPRFPRPEDNLEPNNTRETATQLELNVSVTARAVQGNPDVFRIASGGGELLIFTLESLGEEDCAALAVTGPGDIDLFADRHSFCGDRRYDLPFAAEGAELNTETAGLYVLTIPADTAGDYYLTINELGEVDNIFDFSWLYQLTTSRTQQAE